MNENGRSHLRIVWNKDAKSPNICAYREPVQLSLQLGRDESLIAFVGEAALSGAMLSKLLRTLQPHYLLDLRTCPRFDLFGYSRKKAFSDFERWGAKYYCLSSEEAAKEISDRVNTLVTKLSQDSKNLAGPLVIIVEAVDEVDRISQAMPKPNTKLGKWSITVEGHPL